MLRMVVSAVTTSTTAGATGSGFLSGEGSGAGLERRARIRPAMARTARRISAALILTRVILPRLPLRSNFRSLSRLRLEPRRREDGEVKSGGADILRAAGRVL